MTLDPPLQEGKVYILISNNNEEGDAYGFELGRVEIAIIFSAYTIFLNA